MDLFSLFLLTHENNEIKSPTKIYDFTVIWLLAKHEKNICAHFTYLAGVHKVTI